MATADLEAAPRLRTVLARLRALKSTPVSNVREALAILGTVYTSLEKDADELQRIFDEVGKELRDRDAKISALEAEIEAAVFLVEEPTPLPFKPSKPVPRMVSSHSPPPVPATTQIMAPGDMRRLGQQLLVQADLAEGVQDLKGGS